MGFDTRDVANPSEVRNAGINYWGLGQGNENFNN